MLKFFLKNWDVHISLIMITARHCHFTLKIQDHQLLREDHERALQNLKKV